MAAVPAESAPTRVDSPFATNVPAVPTGASADALVHREVAEVQAAMVMAKRFPRDPVAAMDRILTSCTRPSLAGVAVYQYARGGQDVTGPSIRLAEELARSWGNVLAGVTELARNDGISECLAYAWDLETNYRDEKRFQVRHWRDTKSGGYALKEERDIYELIANQGARRKRACILAIIPGDVQEAAVAQCETTLRTKVEVTAETIAAMAKAFGDMGVSHEMLEKRIQRRLDTMTPALMANLRKIYASLRDGMSSVADWFEAPTGDTAQAVAATGPKPRTSAPRARAKHAAPAPAPEPAPAEPPPATGEIDEAELEAMRRADAEIAERDGG